jgi:endonuclease YncB( thermonuclease family)
MLFRRKKSDGFDWHTYVRTTIKLRRDQRRAKLEDIKRVAAEQAKAAGEAAVQGVAQAAESGWRATAAAWRATIARPSISMPMTLCGLVALTSGAHRALTVTADRQALLPLLLGTVLLLAVAPLLLARWGAGSLKLPAMPDIGGIKVPEFVLPAAAVGAGVLGLGWYAWGPGLPGIGSAAMPSGTGKDVAATVLEGRVSVASAEMVRLHGRLLHLSGIEAPDRQQTCTRDGKQGTWRCGEAAIAALERLARSKTFRCVTQGQPDTAGRTEASCTVDGRDVAGELVKDGHVFSAATFFGGYAAQEAEAKRGKAGVWAGEVERPGEYRAKLWAAAKATAPGGCPIKSQISGARRTFLMPWSSGYTSATPRPERGEGWFCDEAEALAAGFKPSRSGARTAER